MFSAAAVRELFADFFLSLFGYPLAQLMADSPAPASAQLLYNQMMRDILGGGGAHVDPLAQVRGTGLFAQCCAVPVQCIATYSAVQSLRVMCKGAHLSETNRQGCGENRWRIQGGSGCM